MTLLTKLQCSVFWGLACVSILAGSEGSYSFHDHRHRIQLGIPISAPFTVADAVRLPEWNQIRRMTELIKTDRGALDLLREMPLVEANYADESYFLDFIQKWRERIPVLSERPNLEDENGSSWIVLENEEARTIAITFHHDVPENSLTIMKITWVDEQITNLSFTRGFGDVLPHRNRPGRWRRAEYSSPY